MYLVDTSVWIAYINGTQNETVDYLDELLKNPLAVGLTGLIFAEILQGAANRQEFDRYVRYFSGQRFYKMHHAQASYAAAAKLYFDARRAGITIRSIIDCLIVQCAIENELILLHHDRDFELLGQVTQFRQKHFFG